MIIYDLPHAHVVTKSFSVSLKLSEHGYGATGTESND